jgi:hypothetical protein
MAATARMIYGDIQNTGGNCPAFSRTEGKTPKNVFFQAAILRKDKREILLPDVLGYSQNV